MDKNAWDAIEHLLALQEELSRLGMQSVLHTDTVWPRLRVRSPHEKKGQAADFENTVVAAFTGGEWSYYWPWVEHIGTAAVPGRAAAAIACDLGDGDNDHACEGVAGVSGVPRPVSAAAGGSLPGLSPGRAGDAACAGPVQVVPPSLAAVKRAEGLPASRLRA